MANGTITIQGVFQSPSTTSAGPPPTTSEYDSLAVQFYDGTPSTATYLGETTTQFPIGSNSQNVLVVGQFE